MIRNRLIFTLLVLAVLFWSCSAGHDKLVYAYQDRIVDTLSVIAAEKDLFAGNVEGKIFSSGPQTVEALISGSADVAAMGDSAAIILLSKYDNFKIITTHGSGAQRHRIIVGKNISVESWKDLEGLRIGIKKGTSTYGGFIIKSCEMGLDLESSLIEMSPSVQLTALASGEIDVLVASEPTPSIAEDKGIGTFFDSLATGDMSYPIVLVASEKTIEEKSEDLTALIASLQKAELFLTENYEEVLSIHSQLNNFSRELVDGSLSLHDHSVGKASEVKATMENLSRILNETGTISSLPEWEKVLDDSLFPEI
ncbi:MAG: NrtA/SsuA/CpmA family ABC transporter substrate-binding protein [Spirochaetales bacterium]|nr:NrtA/SsuA/CpmA family ABC transporter substrate-binding protein [Spirochaetales bacterium]